MGLKSSEHGVKAILTSRYHDAFRRTESIGDLRKAVGVDREATVIVADGNVMLAQIPQSVGTFADYVGIVTAMIRTMMGSAAIVAVVFDEPQHLTAAKREEQNKRDMQRGKRQVESSADLRTVPLDDDYLTAHVRGLADCHDLVSCRASRQRFFDGVCAEVLARLQPTIDTWQKQGHRACVIWDGLDPRGADRPIGTPREAIVYGTDAATTAMFQRVGCAPIGEGDLKLAWWEQRVRDLARGEDESLSTQLFIQSTIDTDSFALTLNDVASRAVQHAEGEGDVQGCLVMRERANKRGPGGSDARATYLCCDYVHLHDLIQRDMWRVIPAPSQQLLAMRFLTTSWALCGSDFVEVKGMRADHVMLNIRPLIDECPHLLLPFANVTDDDEDAVKSVVPSLRRMVLACAGEVTRKNTAENMRSTPRELLLRGSWVSAYWAKNEQLDTQSFGFSF